MDEADKAMRAVIRMIQRNRIQVFAQLRTAGDNPGVLRKHYRPDELAVMVAEEMEAMRRGKTKA